MKKLYNITDIFHLYYVDFEDNNKEYKIKTFSKEWWKFIWKSRPKIKIEIKTYY